MWQRATSTGLNCDELLFVRAVELGPISGLTAPGSSHPPLLRWILGPLAGRSAPDWSWRLPSVLASMVCVLVWSRILPRMFADRTVGLVLLAVMGMNASFLTWGYLCLPYASLMFFASLHCLSWFWLLESPGRRSQTAFVLSGVCAVATHFYGLNLLVADQLVWIVLLISGNGSRRLWAATTAATALAAAPIVPLAIHYMRLDRPYTIVEISDYAGYFLAASASTFTQGTFFGWVLSAPVYPLWYAAAVILLCRTWRSAPRRSRTTHLAVAAIVCGTFLAGLPAMSIYLLWYVAAVVLLCRTWRSAPRRSRASHFAVAAIVCGTFLAGFPAMQAHSILSGKAMWERYAVSGVWIHLPMIVLLVWHLWGRTPARVAAVGCLCLGLIAFDPGSTPNTCDYRPAVAYLRANGRADDAFFAQDMDLWVGRAHFDRLWFDRYVGLQMPIVSGPRMRRAEICRQGLPLDAAHESIDRVWVFSDLFPESWLRWMSTPGWKLQQLHDVGTGHPLALFVRVDGARPPDPPSTD